MKKLAAGFAGASFALVLSAGSANSSAFSEGTCALGDVTAGVTFFGSTQCANFAGNNDNYGSSPQGFENYINASFGLDVSNVWTTVAVTGGVDDSQNGSWAVGSAIDALFVVTVKAGSFFAAYLFESGTGVLGGKYDVKGATTKKDGGDPAGLSHLTVYTTGVTPISSAAVAAPIPLPAGGLLLLSGLGGLGLLGGLRRKRKSGRAI